MEQADKDVWVIGSSQIGVDSYIGVNLNPDTIDAIPPEQPTGLTATAGIQHCILEWTLGSETDLSYYQIYQNTTNNSATATKAGEIKGAYFVVGDLVANTLYYFWIKAVDKSGNVSEFSDVASATPRLVTAPDLTDAAVTTAKIANLAVDVTKLADLAVEAAKLADSAVTATKIANLAVGSAAIAALAVGTAHIADGAILSAKIGDAQVGNAKIVNLDAAKIDTGTLSADRIGAGSITAGKLNVGQLSAISADVGSLTAGTLTGLLIRTAASGARIELSSSQFKAIDANALTRVLIDTASPQTIKFYKADGALVGSIGTAAENAIKIDASLYVEYGAAFGSQIEPMIDASYDCGASSARWRDAFFSRKVYCASIVVGDGTSAPTLDENGQIKVATVGGVKRIYFRTGNVTGYVNATA